MLNDPHLWLFRFMFWPDAMHAILILPVIIPVEITVQPHIFSPLCVLVMQNSILGKQLCFLWNRGKSQIPIHAMSYASYFIERDIIASLILLLFVVYIM
jgi:hypothetical protein